MRLPTWEELEAQPEQLAVLEHPLDRSLFVVGPPGTGKTVLATERAAQAGRPSSVAVVTFNRMLRRLLNLLDDDLDVFTMHSFVWRDYQRRTGREPPRLPHDRYTYDWKAMLDVLREHPRRHPDREHLVVDEGQDLPEGFYRYASRHVSRVMTVFADDDQALAAQRTALEQIKDAAGLSDPVILNRNHRNTPEIARVAEHFHDGRLPSAAVHRPSSGEFPRLVESTNLESTARLVSRWYRNRGGNVGVIVNRNQTGLDLHADLIKELHGSRVDIYVSGQEKEDSIDLLDPGVTILNKQSVKGQEFDTVFMLELDEFIPCVSEPMRRAMYMMCTRARDNLFLVHGPADLSPAANAALPGPDVLERA